MLSSLKGFVNRHKRKFIAVGVIIGGSIVVFRYVQKKVQEFQTNQTREYLERTRRLHHFEATERTCNQAIVGLSRNLHSEIMKHLNTNEILEELRKNPENKRELWEDLKIISFTRLTTLVYATSILIITLRVTMNILGGYLYKDTVSENAKISEEIRQTYLSSIQHFLTVGVLDLIRLIKTKVKDILDSHPLNEKLGLDDIEQIFWSIQMAVNSDDEAPNKKMSRYVLPTTINEIGLLEKMFNETLDMLETGDISLLCSSNVSSGFSIVVDNIVEYYMQTSKSNEIDGTKQTSKNDLNTVLNINKIELHLAKIIPIINGITSKNFDCTSTSNLTTLLVTFFQVSEKIKTLGSNVYEVFST